MLLNKLKQASIKSLNKNYKSMLINPYEKRTAILVAITFCLTIFFILRTNLFNNIYFQLLLILATTVESILSYFLFRDKLKSLRRSVILISIGLLLIFGNLYTSFFSNSAYNFLNNLQTSGFYKVSYSLISLKTNDSNKSFAYISTDTNNNAVNKIIHQGYKGSDEYYNNLSELILGLENHKFDTGVIRSSLLSLLQENAPNDYYAVKSIKTITINLKDISKLNTTDISKPFIIYISGIDTYGDISTVSRSDVNILCVVNPKTHKILLVNTPRDYYVQLHGTTGLKDKLTHSGIYGINTSVETMEDLYNIKINFYLRINFSSLLKIIDTIGGIRVYSDNDFTVGPYHFIKGYNQMDSTEALAFSRERYAFSDGDRTRGKDQQRVIEAIIKKMNQPIMIARYPSIIRSLQGTFQTNASSNLVAQFINHQANTLQSWATKSISVTGTDSQNYTYSMGQVLLYVMVPNNNSVNSAKANIQQYLTQK